MALPIILNAPTYDVELPLSKKTVTYRPYLVKEEKILMMALESQDQKQIMKTVQDIINACTFGKIKAKDLPTAELELLFLKLRAKSVGETSQIGFECSDCKTPNQVVIDLQAVEIKMPEKALSNKIMITDSVGMILKYPTADDVTKVLQNSKNNGTDVSRTFAIINSCVEAIFDAENTHEAASQSLDILQRHQNFPSVSNQTCAYSKEKRSVVDPANLNSSALMCARWPADQSQSRITPMPS